MTGLIAGLDVLVIGLALIPVPCISGRNNGFKIYRKPDRKNWKLSPIFAPHIKFFFVEENGWKILSLLLLIYTVAGFPGGGA